MRGVMEAARSSALISFGLTVALHGDAFVEADELRIAQFLQRIFQVIFKNIGHRHELDVFVAGQHIDHGLGAAASAADNAGTQLFFARAANEVGLDDGEGRSGGGDVPQQRPPGDRIRLICHDALDVTPARGRFQSWPALAGGSGDFAGSGLGRSSKFKMEFTSMLNSPRFCQR